MIKKKMKLKLVPLMFLVLVLVPAVIATIVLNLNMKEEPIEPDYINEEVIEEILPVIDTTRKIIRPYTDHAVQILTPPEGFTAILFMYLVLNIWQSLYIHCN